MSSPLPGSPTGPGRPVIRVGLVDDHELAIAEFGEVLGGAPGLDLVATAATVADLVARKVPVEIVVLDLVLADGSSAADNVVALTRAGARVLVITGGENIGAIRAAARSGAVGMLRKSEPAEVLLAAVRDGAAGRTVASTEWAAALDSDELLTQARLTDRERDVLALLAAGQQTPAIADRLGTVDAAVLVHIDRVRAKYERVGRGPSAPGDEHPHGDEPPSGDGTGAS